MWFEIPTCPRCHRYAISMLGKALTDMPLVTDEAPTRPTFDWGECSVVSWDSEEAVEDAGRVQLTCSDGHDWWSAQLKEEPIDCTVDGTSQEGEPR